jgi:hypothetical protein
MPKTLKIVLVIVVIAIIWAMLASIDAGPAGFGVILSLLALLDVVTGEFKGNNKLAWLIVCLAGLTFAAVAIGSVMIMTPTASGKQPLYVLGTAVALLLPLAYFLVGRGQKAARTKQTIEN